MLMSLTINQINQLHDSGLMPDLAYYQLNGKDVFQNYQSIRNQIYQKRKEETINKFYGYDDSYEVKIKSEVNLK